MSELKTLQELNALLEKQSYIGGHTPSAEDYEMYKRIFKENHAAALWVARMASFDPDELHAGDFVTRDF